MPPGYSGRENLLPPALPDEARDASPSIEVFWEGLGRLESERISGNGSVRLHSPW